MTDPLIVEYVISLQHAARLMKKMNSKRHRNTGYYFVLDDLGLTMYDRNIERQYSHLIEKYYADYSMSNPVAAYRLRVYRTLRA